MSTRRSVAAWVLVVLASLLTLVSALTLWTKRQLLDTDTWTNSSAQVLAQPEVRNALSNRLVDLLFQRVDVTAELERRLPKAAQGAAPAAAAAIQTAAVRATEAFLTTPQAQRLWEEINRRAHRAIVRVLEGKSAGPVSTANGAVVLDVRPLLGQIGDRLGVGERLRNAADPTTGRIVLLRSDQLDAAQKAVRLLKAVSLFATILVLVLYAAAVAVAHGRRRHFVGICGGSLVVVGLILLVVRRLAGKAVVDSLVHTTAERPPVRAIWLIETTLLRDIALGLVIYGVCLLLAAWLAGPSRQALWIRRTLEPAFEHHPAAVYATAFVVWLVVVAWGPTGGTRQLVGLAILGALIAVGLEVWRRQAIREFGGARTSDDDEEAVTRTG
jgi:hypothetical protein